VDKGVLVKLVRVGDAQSPLRRETPGPRLPEADIIAARTAGIVSVPHIVIDGSTVISGSQEPDAFVAPLTHARTARSKLRT